MKIKIVVGVLSLLGMHHLFTADNEEGIIAKRLAIYSDYYITAMRYRKAANPTEYYNDFLESTQKVGINFDGILKVFKNAQGDNRPALLDAYSRYKDTIIDDDEKRKTVIELLKAADFLNISPLIHTCVYDLSVLYKQLFQDDLQLIEGETELISHVLRSLITKQILLSHQHEFEELHMERRLCGHNNAISFVGYSLDGSQLISASVGEKAIIWDVHRGIKSVEFSIRDKLDLTPHNIELAQQYRSSIMEQVHDGYGYYGAMVTATYSPDCSYMASPSPDDNTVKISRYTKDGYKKLYKLVGHDKPVELVAFSPDGLQLATGSGDKTVILWTNTSFHKTVDSLGMLQALYVHSQLEKWQGFPSTEPKEKYNELNQILHMLKANLQQPTNPLKYDERDEQKDDGVESSFYTDFAHYVGTSVISLFGVDRGGEAFVSLCKERQEANASFNKQKKDDERKCYLERLHDSLPSEIKELLDKKNKAIDRGK